jgi:hypothetical protein
MVSAREPWSDTRDLIEDSLGLLARRQARYPGDDLVAICLLADAVGQTDAALAQRLGQRASWLAIAEALASTVTEVRRRYDGPSWRFSEFPHDPARAAAVRSQPLWQ